MIVLDTNVISALLRPELNTPIVDWLNLRDVATIRITVISLHEIAYGIELAPEGKRKALLQKSWEAFRQSDIGKDILVLHPIAGTRAALARALAERTTGHCDVPDALIAGIALSNGASIATRNIKHFQHFGVSLINPWDAASQS